MIKTSLLSECETVIWDYSEDEIPKWKTTIKDRRKIKDLGDIAIDIFNLDEISVEPVFLSAKSFLSGTTWTTKFRLLLNNGDLLKFTSSEVNALHERDGMEPIMPTHSLNINGDNIDFKDFGLRGRYVNRFITLDFVRDFYFNYWIPSKNSGNSPGGFRNIL
jgi:hypothetical protein